MTLLNTRRAITAGNAQYAEVVDDNFITLWDIINNRKLGTDNIADDGVGYAQLGTDSVRRKQIKDLEVIHSKLAVDAVETDNILDLNVTSGKLAANIPQTKLARNHFQMYSTAAQTLSNSTPTQINFDTSSGVGSFNNTNDTWNPSVDGIWLLVARVSWYGDGSGSSAGSRYVEIRANGGTALANSASKATNVIHHTEECTWVGALTTADAIDVVAEQNSGSAFTPHLIVGSPHWTGFTATLLSV